MSVIIRLQNLPWSANSLDIRQYFRGLSIPEGGVHIVGGEMGDAFIAFSTDEDARQAMMLGGGKIKEVQISLMLSSRSEMQKVIEAARQASMTNSLAQLLVPVQPVVQIPTMPQQPILGAGIGKERRDSKGDKKDSSDLSSGSYEANRRDRREKSRSRSRERNRKDRRDRERDRDRDRERDRRRRSRSRSKSRERRRRRSRSRSKGREIHRDRKDLKDDIRKEKEMTPGNGTSQAEPGKTIPSLEMIGGNSWNMMQPGTIGQAPPLLNNFELLRNLANQRGPLIPEGPNFMAMNSMNQEIPENPDKFTVRNDSPRENFANRNNDFRQSENGQRFNSYDESGFQENIYEGGYRGPNSFQNSGTGFQRNGNEPMPNSRFSNFQRNDNFRAGSRDRGNTRGLLDFPSNIPQRDDRFSNRQDRNLNREDGVDEFGRSIQLRNRKNLSNEENFKEAAPTGFPGFATRFGTAQPNQPPSLLRGREWPPGVRHDPFPERRGRGTFEETTNFRVGKPREPFRKYHEEDPTRYVERDCCVELRNLAPHIAYGEVRRPFSNMKLIIKEIKFFDYSHRDKKCRIRFLNNENKRKAMQASSKILIDNKPIQLLHINDSDFDEIQDEGVKRPDLRFSDDEDDANLSPKDVCIQAKDLPINVTEEDITKLFPNTVLEKIVLEVSGDGKSKAGYIKFEKTVDCKVALGTPNRSIGDSVVFLEPLPLYEFNDILCRQTEKAGEPTQPEVLEVSMEEPKKPEEPQEEEIEKSSCILMKNLPFEANDRDICDFFSDIGLVPNKIHLMLDMTGQPSGDAFCEFSDLEQAERACSKNSAPLGKNSVTVLQVPQEEMLEALGVVEEVELDKEEDPSETFGRPQCVLALENIPFRATVFDIIKFFGWSYSLTEADILRRYNERGQPTGDARVCVKTPEDAIRAVRFLNNRSLMGRVVRMKVL